MLRDVRGHKQEVLPARRARLEIVDAAGAHLLLPLLPAVAVHGLLGLSLAVGLAAALFSAPAGAS